MIGGKIRDRVQLKIDKTYRGGFGGGANSFGITNTPQNVKFMRIFIFLTKMHQLAPKY